MTTIDTSFAETMEERQRRFLAINDPRSFYSVELVNDGDGFLKALKEEKNAAMRFAVNTVADVMAGPAGEVVSTQERQTLLATYQNIGTQAIQYYKELGEPREVDIKTIPLSVDAYVVGKSDAEKKEITKKLSEVSHVAIEHFRILSFLAGVDRIVLDGSQP